MDLETEQLSSPSPAQKAHMGSEILKEKESLMSAHSIRSLIESQKSYFQTGKTKSIESRKLALKKLKKMIQDNESKIIEALRKDLGKSDFEGYVAEVGYVLNDLNHTMGHLKKWMKGKKVSGPLLQFPSSCWIRPEPVGTVLIVGPWNYPFQLVISPLIAALAAGNTAILKPSEFASHTSSLLYQLVGDSFEKAEVAVVEGGVPETNQLLDQRFDHIFFTGSSRVGKIVMEKASKNLTPVTLELGGKSPCIVFGKTDLDLTAKRIVWGKFFNTGQTCVAPDYILVEKGMKEPLVEKIQKYTEEMYGKDPKNSDSYGKIINQSNFNRVKGLLTKEKVYFGGDFSENDLYISPTVVEGDLEAPLMKEEIFGPILPIIEKSSIKECIDYINEGEKPLALYLFTKEKRIQDKVVNETSSGGVCLNDTIVHLTSANLPFGGVGNSGLGMYHGKYGFDSFSHQKAIMKRYFFLDLPLRYPPYLKNFKFVKWLLGILG